MCWFVTVSSSHSLLFDFGKKCIFLSKRCGTVFNNTVSLYSQHPSPFDLSTQHYITLEECVLVDFRPAQWFLPSWQYLFIYLIIQTLCPLYAFEIEYKITIKIYRHFVFICNAVLILLSQNLYKSNFNIIINNLKYLHINNSSIHHISSYTDHYHFYLFFTHSS